MADQADDPHIGAEPAAAGVALGRAPRSKDVDARAAEYLAKQSRVLDSQLEDQDLHHRHLRLKYFGDRLRIGLQLLAIVFGLAVAVGLGALVWQAHEADGVVIEAFSVPPDLGARGLTGQVLASQVQDRLNALQAATFSDRPAASYSNTWGHDIKVEIPETGVSVGELQRVLVAWLGHESRISGEVFRGPAGLSLTIRNEDGGQTVSGPEDQLEGLLQRGAEALYARTEPYRYAAWLRGQNRRAEAKSVLEKLMAEGPASEKPWALSALADMEADASRSLALAERAVALDPNLAVGWLSLAGARARHGDNDLSGVADRRFLALIESPGRGGAGPKTLIAAHLVRAIEAGNVAEWQTNRREDAIIAEQSTEAPRRLGATLSMAFAAASMHEATEARRLQGGGDDAQVSRALGRIQFNSLMGAFWIQDWAEVVRQGEGLIAVKDAMRVPDQADLFLRRQVYPPLSTALVRLGRLDEARALQAQMPEACDFCRQDRAAQLELSGDHAGAERGWAEMIRRNPKYVFPYNWRAYYRLQRGDFDGAIAATMETNKLGPHWADPLEIWAEALAGKGDFAGAAAKYQEANQYAPRWGRLHLKWGETLAKLGKRDAARAQFKAAASMDLGPADRTELAGAAK